MLRRFAFRHVVFDAGMAKAFYRLPEKGNRAAIAALAEDGILLPADGGYMLADDREILDACRPEPLHLSARYTATISLYKSNEPVLKAWAAALTEGLPLRPRAAAVSAHRRRIPCGLVGHFPTDRMTSMTLSAICRMLTRRDEILQAVAAIDFGKTPLRFMERQYNPIHYPPQKNAAPGQNSGAAFSMPLTGRQCQIRSE